MALLLCYHPDIVPMVQSLSPGKPIPVLLIRIATRVLCLYQTMTEGGREGRKALKHDHLLTQSLRSGIRLKVLIDLFTHPPLTNFISLQKIFYPSVLQTSKKTSRGKKHNNK